MRMLRIVVYDLAVCVCAGPFLAATAQEREPLNDNEIGELREAAQEPLKRMRLYVSFSGSRLLDIDNLQDKNNVPDRGQQIHDLLQDFSTLKRGCELSSKR